MGTTLLKVGKIVVTVAGVVVTLASNYFAEKDLNEKIAKKVAEAVAEKVGKES